MNEVTRFESDAAALEKAWDEVAEARGRRDYVADLQAAVDTFADIGAGCECDQLKLDAGALALHVLASDTTDSDVVEAAAILKDLATAGRVDIDADGRKRAAYLARVVDEFRQQARS